MSFVMCAMSERSAMFEMSEMSEMLLPCPRCYCPCLNNLRYSIKVEWEWDWMDEQEKISKIRSEFPLSTHRGEKGKNSTVIKWTSGVSI